MSHAITLLGFGDGSTMPDPNTMTDQQIQAAFNTVPHAPIAQPPSWLTILAVASAAVSGFHGYRRNKSIFWAGVWFLAGGLFPIFTGVIAVAQGFAKPKRA